MSENRSVEASGANIEEAIEAGLRELQVSRESVIVEIIDEPNRGFLGVGSKGATVRLTTAARVSRPTISNLYEDDAEVETFEDDEASIVRPPDVDNMVNASEDIQVGADKLRGLLSYLTDGTEVSIEQSPTNEDGDNTLVLQVYGDNINHLIGKKGETLAAIQYLTRLMASRDLQRRANFVVDIGEYKASRSDKLFQLAHRMADQAVSRKKTMHMEPMPPHERRIIHMALRKRDDVTTTSVGEGRFRKVTIIPNRHK